MAIYESIFIMDSLVPPKDIDAAIERFSGIITENGGTIRKVDKWGKKRLAYEIEKKQYGFYVSIEFEGTGNIPAFLESDYNFNDKVLRYLTYHYDKNKLKVMKVEDEGKKETAKPPVPEPAPAPAPEPKNVTPEVTEEPAEQAEKPAEQPAEAPAEEKPSES
jgi:small subunit ribosomal protein S6